MTVAYEELVHRPFLFGVRDCYAIVRDFYRINFDMELIDFARPKDWQSDNHDLIRRCYERDGFEMITDWKAKDLRPGDILCMAIGESCPNHLAVFVGDNKVVHHLYGRNSTEDTYRDFFRAKTSFILRHPDVPDLRPTYPDTTIGSLLRDRYAVQPSE